MNENVGVRLARYRAVESWLDWQISQVREVIGRLESEEAATAARRPALPVPDWKLEIHRTGYGPQPFRVHAGSCPDGQGKPVERAEVLRLLGEGVEACPFCRPDAALGVLE
ncbi:DUF6233 domain-containing protein [Streptomyces sp. NBC_01264]|uniref:DUF6233 domain-containing protein n=1 Tax=Streptomyces sp. NBC_01264 TaxID=2903804 RepID=UPI0022596B7E|nr:DUF6233 domain-containing protein [Streptomyces sp. NBC_01264]MCX4784622.1 DUF6233 domain-containing protein [Streptomyces sp. NBC_01264]